MKKPTLCIVAHNSYGALTSGSTGQIGGVEQQTVLMAKWFVGKGYEVSMITWDEGGGAEEHGEHVGDVFGVPVSEIGSVKEDECD